MHKSNHYLSVLLAATLLPISLQAQRAVGLTTDMLEHTDRVWICGYPSSSSLSDLPQLIEPWQTAKVCSSHPVLGWRMESLKPNTRQKACRVLVATKSEKLREGVADVWDSGRLETSIPSVECGKNGGLKPSTVYYWTVKLWDNHGGEGDYAPARCFRTADKLDADISHYPIELTDERPVSSVGTLYDFGTDGFAHLSLTITATGVADTLTLHLGERCADGHVDRHPTGSIRYSRYTLPLIQGTHTYRVKIRKDKRNTTPKKNESGVDPILMPGYVGEVMPMRYCELELPAAKTLGSADHNGDITIVDIVRHTAHYPFNELTSDFACSDTTLCKVWNLCKYSMRALSFAGIYVDGDRERIPYEADAIINQLSHYAVDRDYSIARRSVRHLIYHPTWPTEWILQSVIMAWNDYLYTGDKRLLAATYESLKAKTLSALKDDNQLISTRNGKVTPDVLRSIHFAGKNIRDIVDWPQKGAKGIEKEGEGESDGFVFTNYNTVVNAYHYNALRLMAQVARVLGKEADADGYRKEAVSTREAINRLLINPANSLYRDGIDTDHTSLHANMFALDFGLVTDKNRRSVVDFVKSRGMGCSVYGAQFLLDALYDNDEDDYALSLLTATGKRSWYNMLRTGSTITTEAWDNVYKSNQDWNHAWGAAAANIIVRKLMGVEPLEPGFSRIRIKPQTGSLSWARLSTPTIRGDVHLNITGQGMEVDIPANTTAEVWTRKQARTNSVTVDGKPVKGKRSGNYVIVSVGSGKHTIK